MGSTQEELKQILTNLVIERQFPSGWTPSSEDRESLVSGLEAALVDRDTLQPILAHLGTLPAEASVDATSLFDSEADLRSVLEHGLGALYTQAPDLFYRTVVDPFVLLGLRDAIIDELPPYWWEQARRLANREPRTAREIWDAARAGAEQTLVVTAFDGEAGPRRWMATTTAAQVTRILPAGAPAPTVTVECSLVPVPPDWRLEVDLLDPPPRSDSRRTGVLVSAAGVVIAQGEDDAGVLTFALMDADLAAGIELLGEYQRGEEEHLQFRLPIIIP